MMALMEALNHDPLMDSARVRSRNRLLAEDAVEAGLPAADEVGATVRKYFPFKREFSPLTMRHFRTGSSFLQ